MARQRKILLLFLVIILLVLYGISSSIVARLIYPLEYRTLIVTESEKFKLDPALVAAVIFEESKFNEFAESRSGALGLMQLMPETAQWAAKNIKMSSVDNNDLYNPDINVRLGCWYLRFLLNKYEREDLALAAYNSGHQNVDKWMKQKDITKYHRGEIIIGYGETRHYVKNVKGSKDLYRKLYWSY